MHAATRLPSGRLLAPAGSKVAGASGGSLVAAGWSSGFELEAYYQQTVQSASRCRSLAALVNCPPFSETSQLRAIQASQQQPDTYKKCSGHTYLQISHVSGRGRGAAGRCVPACVTLHACMPARPPADSSAGQSASDPAPLPTMHAAGELVSQFSSNDDLVDAILASAHLPFVADGAPW